MSRSSKGGGTANYNELRFEDKMGDEQIFINAEKDMDLRVETIRGSLSAQPLPHRYTNQLEQIQRQAPSVEGNHSSRLTVTCR